MKEMDKENKKDREKQDRKKQKAKEALIPMDIMLVKGDPWKKREELRKEIRKRFIDSHEDRERMTDDEIEHILETLEHLYLHLWDKSSLADRFILGISENNLCKALLFADDTQRKYPKIFETFLVSISDQDLPGVTKDDWEEYRKICTEEIERKMGKEFVNSMWPPDKGQDTGTEKG